MVVVIVEMEGSLESGEHEEDGPEVYRSLIESLSFPCPKCPSARTCEQYSYCLLLLLSFRHPGKVRRGRHRPHIHLAEPPG